MLEAVCFYPEDKTMADTEVWQVSTAAAEVYEASFVPAIFAAWAPRLLAAANVGLGDHVLDVACGTGIAARHALNLVKPGGAVVGLDINEGMLTVARRVAPGITWQQGDAAALPFQDRAFTAVVSQFGMMFFPDRPLALREMWRVLSPGGRLAVAVLARLDEAPGYQSLVAITAAQVGAAEAGTFAAPFVMGDPAVLAKAAKDAGIANASVVLHRGQVRFASIEEFVRVEVKGSPLAETLDQAAMDRLAAACGQALQPYVQVSGELVMPIAAHILTAKKL